MATDPMVIYGQGQCRECGGRLVVIDSEATLLELEDNGSPRNETTIVKIIAKCTHCGKTCPMLRKGLSYEHDTPSTRIEHWYKRKRRAEQFKKRMEELQAPEDNPFFLPKNK